MKKTYLLGSMLLISCITLGIVSCNDVNDEFKDKGSCSVVSFDGPEQVFMGDSINFNFEIAGTGDIKLDQSKIQLFFGDEIVSERILSTPTSGKYSGKLLIPFLKDIPDSEVDLKLRIQNEYFANNVSERKINVIRPKFPKLILRDENGQEYDMLPSNENPYEYSVTKNFPTELYATIIAPKYGDNGNEMFFGNSDGKIINGSTQNINFTADVNEGEDYKVTFNTQTFEGTPFIKFALNDIEFTKVDELHFKVETNLKQGQDINITGLKSDYVNYWINYGFFRKVSGTDGKTLRFMGRDGLYRVTVDKSLKYFRVEVMNAAGTDVGDLNNGDDVIWCVGGSEIGQPSYATNAINWAKDDKVICLVPIGGGRHQMILKAGENIKTNYSNFKFRYQKTGWNGQFFSNVLSWADDSKNNVWFKINTDPSNDGNIINGTTTLTNGKYYVFTIDMSAGKDKSKLSVEEVDGFDEVEPLSNE